MARGDALRWGDWKRDFDTIRNDSDTLRINSRRDNACGYELRYGDDAMRGAITRKSQGAATERIGHAARDDESALAMGAGQPCRGERVRVVRVDDIEMLLMKNFVKT